MENPTTIVHLYIQDKINQFLLMKDAPATAGQVAEVELPWHLPGMILARGTSLDETLPAISATQLGFTISPRDCRLKLVHEHDVAGSHTVHLVYHYRLLRPIHLTAWGDTAQMCWFTSTTADIATPDDEILGKLLR